MPAILANYCPRAPVDRVFDIDTVAMNSRNSVVVYPGLSQQALVWDGITFRV